MVMDEGDREVVAMRREWADKEASKDKALAERYQSMAAKYIYQAGEAAEEKDYAQAAQLRRLADQATNSMHYYLGHMNAYMGIATQLGFAEIVEEELEEEGSCP